MTSYELRVTDADIGRSVLYFPRSGKPPRQGIIMGHTPRYVFVLFLHETRTSACNHIDLEYVP